VSENGIVTRILDAQIASARHSPPTVALARLSFSSRSSQYMPSPANSGCSTMNARIAIEHGSKVYRSIGGKYIHPDCGSAMNGAPSIAFGFHNGMTPSRRDSPKKQ
jgi:hypothetical protein